MIIAVALYLWVAAFFVATTTRRHWATYVADLAALGYSPLSMWLIAICGFLLWPLTRGLDLNRWRK